MTESSKLRTSKQTWLHDVLVENAEEPEVRVANRLSWRIQLATRMHVLSFLGGEMYQVANYGIGGQYHKHYDAFGGDHDW